MHSLYRFKLVFGHFYYGNYVPRPQCRNLYLGCGCPLDDLNYCIQYQTCGDVNRTIGVTGERLGSLDVPRLPPAFCHLQCGKTGKAWENFTIMQVTGERLERQLQAKLHESNWWTHLQLCSMFVCDSW